MKGCRLGAGYTHLVQHSRRISLVSAISLQHDRVTCDGHVSMAADYAVFITRYAGDQQLTQKKARRKPGSIDFDKKVIRT